MRNKFFLMVCIFPLAVMGCMGPKYSIPLPASNTEGQNESMLEFLNIYPEEFKLSQHIIMKVKGKEYEFIGYLVVKGKKGFRALAFGEMGGKIFDFLEWDGKREVVTKPDAMSSSPLFDGVIGDISHLYDSGQFEDAFTSMNNGNMMILVLRKQGNRVAEYNFSKGGNLKLSMEALDGRLVREVKYEDFRLYPGWAKPLPSRITLINHRWHYELRIELFKIDVGPVDEKIFLNNKKE